MSWAGLCLSFFLYNYLGKTLITSFFFFFYLFLWLEKMDFHFSSILGGGGGVCIKKKKLGFKPSAGVPGANTEIFIAFGLRVWPLYLDTHIQIYLRIKISLIKESLCLLSSKGKK